MFKRAIITTPLGSISCKIWGDVQKSTNKFISVHGWMDNNGSFDRLAPLFDHYDSCIVALDLPGHGKSYHRQGPFYHFPDYVLDIKLTVDQLGWKKFNFMSHSMGAIISSVFAGVFPERVEKMMMIDGIGGMLEQPNRSKDLLFNAIQSYEALYNKKPKVYSWEEALSRITERGISKEGAECLLKEGSEQVDVDVKVGDKTEKGIVFTHHNLLRTNSPLRYTIEHMETLMENVNCPVMLIRATKGWEFPEKVVERCLTSIKNKNQHEVIIAEVQGGHHVHLDDPKLVLEQAIKFFNLQQN